MYEGIERQRLQFPSILHAFTFSRHKNKNEKKPHIITQWWWYCAISLSSCWIRDKCRRMKRIFFQVTLWIKHKNAHSIFFSGFCWRHACKGKSAHHLSRYRRRCHNIILCVKIIELTYCIFLVPHLTPSSVLYKTTIVSVSNIIFRILIQCASLVLFFLLVVLTKNAH